MSKTATAISTLPSPAELAKMGFETVSAKPAIFKLRELPVNGVIDGVLKEIRPSTNPEAIRQPLLRMELTEDKSTTLVPCQGGLSSRIFSEPDGKYNPELKTQLKSRFLGKRVLIVKTGFKLSNTYKDDSGKPKEFATYEVIEYKGK
jgi:hypothetical protein